MVRRPLYPIAVGVADGHPVANSDFSTSSVINKFKQTRCKPYRLRTALKENSNRVVAAVVADDNDAGYRGGGVSVNLAEPSSET